MMNWLNSVFLSFTAAVLLFLSGVTHAQQDEITYFHYDALGSPILATDETGGVKWREQYAPYGARLLEESRELDCTVTPCEPTNSPWENRQFYTGKYDEASVGITYFGARWYEPSLGRFLSVDPVDFHEENIFSFNQYAYGNNNPYRYADPDGNSPVDVLFLAADIGKLAAAVYSGSGVGAAAVDVGLSLIGVASPIPGTGQALKAGRAAAKVTKGLHRPYIRKGTRAEVEARATRSADGRFVDPNTGAPIDGKYDLGHKPGNEFRREKARGEAEGLSQKQFNDRMNNPDLYQIENPSSNRSHKFEKPGND